MKSAGSCRQVIEILVTDPLSTAPLSCILLNGGIFEQIEKYEQLPVTPIH